MANTKSALKNARKARTRMVRNRQARSRIKTLERQFKTCVEANDENAARKASAEFISALDRAAKSSIIHHNKAKRKKSSCSKKLAGIAVSSSATKSEPTGEEPVAEAETDS